MADSAGKKRAGGEKGGKKKKNKKQYIGGRGAGLAQTSHWANSYDRTPLNSGVKGVLISCDTRKENLCMQEALSLFEEYVEKLYPDEVDALDLGDDAEAGTGDAATELAKEVDAQKKKAKALFATIKGLVFIRFIPPWMDPVRVVEDVVSDAMATKTTRTKYCVKLVPCQTSCFADLESLLKVAKPMFAPIFHREGQEPVKFALVYRCRSNSSFVRDDCIKQVADLIGQGTGHKVDLTNPDFTVIIEIMTNTALLSVTTRYNELRKYNLVAAVEDEEERAKAAAERKAEAAKKKEAEEASKAGAAVAAPLDKKD